MPVPSVVDRIARFVAQPIATEFETLALAAFRFQYERIEPFRRLCESVGAGPATVTAWHQVPPVPTLAFKRLELAAAPPREVFRSSGTRGERSVHRHAFPDLYRQVVDATFPAACLPGTGAPILSLVPSRALAPDSSLAFMAEHVLQTHGGPGSTVAFGPRGVDATLARSWASARQRQGRPALVLATAFALASWLDALERRHLRFQLPPGSVVFETGGFKGRTAEISRAELVARTGAFLGVPPGQIVREYGMTELTSQLYTRARSGGDPELLLPPPWMRVRALHPESLAPLANGEVGLVAIFDLANVGSAVHVLTEDLGAVEGGGLRLVGRAPDAELRGCSLTVEELAGRGA